MNEPYLPDNTICAVVPTRYESATPSGYRLVKKLSGELVLEAAYCWSDRRNNGLEYNGIEWREIPTRLEELK